MKDDMQLRIYEALYPIMMQRIRYLDVGEAEQLVNALINDCGMCPCYENSCTGDVSTNCRESLKKWLRTAVKA